MTLSYGPKLGLLENAATGEVHDDAFRKFLRGMDGMTQLSVKDKDLSTPPGSPLNGDCYLVASSPTPTGAWTGGANKIARYSSHSASWELWTPYAGWICWVQDESTEYRYNGTAWGLNAWSAASLQFSTTSAAPPHNPGLVYWDKDLKCMAYHAAVAGVSNQVGEELWVRAYNNTGSLIPNGSVVYISGAQAGLPTMALADASNLAKCGAVGVVTHDVANASEGFVTRFGMVRGLNTNGLTDGAPVYLSATTPGAWTVTPPTTGYLLTVGAIALAAPSGTIYVRPHPPLAIDPTLATPGSNLVAPTQLAVKTAVAGVQSAVDAIEAIGTDTHWTSGFISRTDNTFGLNNGTRTVTITPTGASFGIYLDAVKFAKTAVSTTFPATVGMHFIKFDATATLVNSMTSWVILDGLAPATIAWWNGSAARLVDERHWAGRNLSDHNYLHKTRGTAYQSGLAQTYPTSAQPGWIQIEQGYIHDEDIQFFIPQQKKAVLWYLTAAGQYTWANAVDNAGYDRPYIWNAGTSRIQYPKSDAAYALTDCAANNYLALWVYAGTDATPGDVRPIYIVVPALTSPYGNLAAADAATEPSIANLLYPELKLIYKWVFKGDGTYMEAYARDYRTASSLPGGIQTTIEHNNTTNKQGGTTGEYYHLTSAQATQVSQLNGTAAKTLSWQNTLTLVGTDGTTLTFPTTNATIARNDEAQTFGGVQTFAGRVLVDDTTEATTTTNGSLQTDGGLSVVKNAVIGGTLNSGPASITGTTATDGPTFSAELLTSSDWTTTDWTGDFATGFTHTTGNTTALTNTLAAVIGNKYQITYTITDRTAGSITISFGGLSTAGVTSTGAFGPTATTTGNLTITPTTDFNGKIVISVKQITAGSSAVYTIKDSAGNIKSEIRAVSALYNTANGYQALYYNTTGSHNTANGYQALYYNTTGSYNTANGYQALYYNTTGSYNTANGPLALYRNTTGSYNTANGPLAGYDNTTGVANSFFGYNTGRGITTGSNNTILGANVTGLSAATSNHIVLATGQGTVRARFNGTRWNMPLSQLSIYANNAAAISGGLASGDIYRTGGDPDLVCVVH